MNRELDRLKRNHAFMITLADLAWVINQVKEMEGGRIDVVVTYKASEFSSTLFGVSNITITGNMITISGVDSPYNMTIPINGPICWEDITPEGFGANYGKDGQYTIEVEKDLSVALLVHTPQRMD